MNYHTPLPAFSSYGVPPSQGWVQLNRERQAVEANLQTMANQERAASPYVAELLAALVKDCADGSQRACSDLRKVRGKPATYFIVSGGVFQTLSSSEHRRREGIKQEYSERLAQIVAAIAASSGAPSFSSLHPGLAGFGSLNPATEEQKARNLVWFVVALGGMSALFLFPALWQDLTGKKK